MRHETFSSGTVYDIKAVTAEPPAEKARDGDEWRLARGRLAGWVFLQTGVQKGQEPSPGASSISQGRHTPAAAGNGSSGGSGRKQASLRRWRSGHGWIHRAPTRAGTVEALKLCPQPSHPVWLR